MTTNACCICDAAIDSPRVEGHNHVTESALIRRINRKLAHRGEVLRTARGRMVEWSLGRHYVFDVYRNTVVWQQVNVPLFAKELGVAC